MTQHLIAEVRFTMRQLSDLAPITCFCGWIGTVREWQAHRGKTNDVRARPNRPSRFRDAPLACNPQGRVGSDCLGCGRRLILGKMGKTGRRGLQHAGSGRPVAA